MKSRNKQINNNNIKNKREKKHIQKMRRKKSRNIEIFIQNQNHCRTQKSQIASLFRFERLLLAKNTQGHPHLNFIPIVFGEFCRYIQSVFLDFYVCVQQTSPPRSQFLFLPLLLFLHDHRHRHGFIILFHTLLNPFRIDILQQFGRILCSTLMVFQNTLHVVHKNKRKTFYCINNDDCMYEF